MPNQLFLIISAILGFSTLFAAENSPYDYHIHVKLDVDGVVHEWANLDVDGDGVFDGNYVRRVDDAGTRSDWSESCEECPRIIYQSVPGGQIDQQLSKFKVSIYGNEGKPRISSENIKVFSNNVDEFGNRTIIKRYESKGFYIERGIATYDIEGMDTDISPFSAIITDLKGKIYGHSTIDGEKLVFPIDNLDKGAYMFIVSYNGNQVANFKFIK